MRLLLIIVTVAALAPAVAEEAYPDLRLGFAEGEARLQITWPAPAGPRWTRHGGEVILELGGPINLPLRDMAARLAPWLSDLRATARPAELKLVLQPDTAIDIAQPSPREQIVTLRREKARRDNSASSPSPSLTGGPYTAVRVERSGTGQRLVVEHPGRAARLGRILGGILIRASAPFGVDPDALTTSLRSSVRSVSIEQQVLSLMLGDGVLATPVVVSSDQIVVEFTAAVRRPRIIPLGKTEVPRAGPQIVAVAPGAGPVAMPPRPAPRPAVSDRSEVALLPASGTAPVKVPPERAGNASAPQKVTPAPLPLTSTKAAPAPVPEPYLIRVATHGTRLPPAAIFLSGNSLWIAVAAPIATLDQGAGPALLPVERVPVSPASAAATIFRLKLTKPMPLAVRAEGTSWVVALASGVPALSADDMVRTEPEKNSVLVGGATAALDATDPASGELLGLALSDRPGRAQARPQRFVDVAFLPAVQGAAWRRLSTELTASVEPQGVRLARKGGLRLGQTPWHDAPAQPGPIAGTPAVAVAPATAPETLPGASAIDLVRLGPTTAAERRRRRYEIEASLPGLDDVARAGARLELARLYLADAAGTEASTMLALASTPTLAAPWEDDFQRRRSALAGAAAALAGRKDEALSRLLDTGLDEDAEVGLWRAYAADFGARPDIAVPPRRVGMALLDRYPEPLRRQLGMRMAAALVAAGDTGRSIRLLDGLQGVATHRSMVARIHFLRGQAFLRSGRVDLAESEFALAAAGGDQQTRADASYELTLRQHAGGELVAATAATRLAALRPLWRHVRSEATRLQVLASLERKAGDNQNALATLAEAIVAADEPEQVRMIAADIAAILRDRTNPVEANGPAAITAVALYQVGKHLLAATPRADELRVRMAALASDMGLVGTTAAILASPPAGVSRTRGMARMKRDEANCVAGRAGTELRQRNVGPLPLKCLEAAHAGMKVAASGGAFPQLDHDPGGPTVDTRHEAALLRQDWPQVERQARERLDQIGPEMALDEATQRAVLELALARAGQDDFAAAGQLITRFGARMARPHGKMLLDILATGQSIASGASNRPEAIVTVAQAIQANLANLPPLQGQPSS